GGNTSLARTFHPEICRPVRLPGASPISQARRRVFGIFVARKYPRVAELHTTLVDPGRRRTLDPGIAARHPGNVAKSRCKQFARANLLDEFKKTRTPGEGQRGKTGYRKNTPGNAVQPQGRRPPPADQLQGAAAKTPGV